MSTAFFDTVVAQPGKKRVTTTLRGYYSGPFANTGFELDIHDTLGIDSNKFLTCKTTTALDMETTVDTVLNDIFHAAFIHGDDFARLIGQGPACYAVESLPKQWLLPGKVGENLGLKQVFRWTRFKVDNSGLHLGGTHSTEARVPAVTIKGPDPLKVELGDPIAGVYKAEVTDLRPPITYQWTSQNAVASGSGPTTTLTWNITLHNNQYVSRVIHVTATDADGIKASASRTVQIRRVVSSDLPDFCPRNPGVPSATTDRRPLAPGGRQSPGAVTLAAIPTTERCRPLFAGGNGVRMGNCGCSVASVANSHIEILPAFPGLISAPRGDAELERERSRSRAFLQLFPHLVDAERFEGGFRWVFLAAAGLERELRTLARREHARSPFLTFVISVQGDRLVWKTCGRDGTGRALDALYGMIAEPAVAFPEMTANAVTKAS